MNITRAKFGTSRTTITSHLYQYDYGQILKIIDLELPVAYEVHFSNDEHGTSKTQIGDSSGVMIPDEYLLTGKTVYAWIYLHTGEDDGETEYKITIPVKQRAQPTDAPPTPVQQSVIDQAIAALNAAVTQTGEDVTATGQSAAQAALSASEAALSAENAGASATAAAASASAASASAAAASQSETNAGRSETVAGNSATAAASSASSAATSADRAEQAATTAGYMIIEIDEHGHLIYTRTDQVDVDFSLEDGHLIMEAVA